MIMIDILWNNRAIWHRKHYVTSSIGVTDNTPRRRVELLNLVVRPITLKRSKLLCYLSQSRHDVEIKDLYSLWNIDHVSFSQINQVLCIMLIYGYKNWSMFSGLCKAWILKNSYYSTFVTFVSSNSKLPITSYKMPLPWTSKNIYKGSHIRVCFSAISETMKIRAVWLVFSYKLYNTIIKSFSLSIFW